MEQANTSPSMHWIEKIGEVFKPIPSSSGIMASQETEYFNDKTPVGAIVNMTSGKSYHGVIYISHGMRVSDFFNNDEREFIPFIPANKYVDKIKIDNTSILLLKCSNIEAITII